MANAPIKSSRGIRIIFLNKRVIVSFLLLVAVVTLISSNQFWRWMYPISYQTQIQQAAQVAEVNPLLVASVIRVESKFKRTNVSHAGAVGLMQLMPQTAQWIAQQAQQNPEVANQLNKLRDSSGQIQLGTASANIQLGSWYIHYLMQQFDGNQVAAIAAYNAGPQRVSQWISSGQWDGQLSTISEIPVGETRHFVDRVFYNLSLYERIYGNDTSLIEFNKK